MTALRWFGLALLGILIAAGVSIAASRLASQQIGLASQPITAGDALVPRASPRPAPRKHSPGRPHTPAPTTTTQSTQPPPTTIPTSPTTPAGPTRSGGGEGDGGGGGGADD